MESIAKHIYPSIYVNLNIEAQLMPGYPAKRSVIFPGEFAYFPHDPEYVRKNLSLLCEDEPKIKYNKDWRREAEKYESSHDYDDMMEDRMSRRMMMMDFRLMHRKGQNRKIEYEDDLREMFGRDMDEDMLEDICHYNGIDPRQLKKKKMKVEEPKQNGPKALLEFYSETKDVTTTFLMEKIFKIWCSVLLQKSRMNEKIHSSIYDMMTKCFSVYAEKEAAQAIAKLDSKNQSIEARFQRKTKMTLMTEFDHFIKGSRDTVNINTKFGDQIKLAEAVLKTTVTDKYEKKLLLKKGYGDNKEWNEDMQKFMEAYEAIKPQIQELPEPTMEDQCRIMLQSFVGDLMDKDFSNIVCRGKSNFLKEMTFSGVPILAPLKDSNQFNPWTLQVTNICVSPFEIICQRVMEEYAQSHNNFKYNSDKSMYLKGTEISSKINRIIPLIPRECCELLKPLVTSTVYAVACTYCILKNPNIIDRNCHLAALGCIWMKSIKEFLPATRPEYIENRILNIEANAKLYLDRKTVSAYVECLLRYPYMALTTESEETYKGVKMKCESLIKPAFLFHLAKDNKELMTEYSGNIPKFIQLLTMEFFGRCITKYQSATPFIDFFLPSVEKDVRTKWLELKSKVS